MLSSLFFYFPFLTCYFLCFFYFSPLFFPNNLAFIHFCFNYFVLTLSRLSLLITAMSVLLSFLFSLPSFLSSFFIFRLVLISFSNSLPRRFFSLLLSFLYFSYNFKFTVFVITLSSLFFFLSPYHVTASTPCSRPQLASCHVQSRVGKGTDEAREHAPWHVIH